jgi:hypothetical protein
MNAVRRVLSLLFSAQFIDIVSRSKGRVLGVEEREMGDEGVK